MGETLLSIYKERHAALITPKEGEPYPVGEVIFNAVYQEVDVNGVEYGAPYPAAWVSKKLHPGILDNSILTIYEADGITGKDYIIRHAEDDGLELYRLKLHEKIGS